LKKVEFELTRQLKLFEVELMEMESFVGWWWRLERERELIVVEEADRRKADWKRKRLKMKMKTSFLIEMTMKDQR